MTWQPPADGASEPPAVPPSSQPPQSQSPPSSQPPQPPPDIAPPIYPPPPLGASPTGAEPATPTYRPYPAAPARPTNTMAIIALVCSMAGFLTLVSAPVGAVLGHLARRQIRQTGEDGDSLALAAIIAGWALTGLAVIGCCVGTILFFTTAGSIETY